MKKVLIAVAAVFLVLLVAVYVVLFTSFGNKIVAGIVEDKAKEAGLELNVSKFVLRFSSLDIEVDVANMLNAKVEGNLSLFRLGFDIAYLLSVDKEYVKTLNLNLAQNVSFGGKVAGKASDFRADGKGFLFGSNIAFGAHIVDYSPLELKLEANGIKIEELLDLVSMPRYALGVLNLNADISVKDLKPDGTASINLYTKAINYALLKKDMNLTLPAKSEPMVSVLAKVSNDKVLATSEVSNDFIAFNTQNTEYDLTKGVLNTDFATEPISSDTFGSSVLPLTLPLNSALSTLKVKGRFSELLAVLMAPFGTPILTRGELSASTKATAFGVSLALRLPSVKESLVKSLFVKVARVLMSPTFLSLPFARFASTTPLEVARL